MSNAVTHKHSDEIARPLKVLVPLIKHDFEEAEEAGMPYYKAAGAKLVEAREGHFDGDAAGFFKWAERNFGKTSSTLRTYMALAGSTKPKSFESLRHFAREGLGRASEIHRPSSIQREWTAPVDAIADKAREEARRLALKEQLTRQQEREAEMKLGLRLIDIGYKVLAKELHSDKIGGSKDAMQRLNKVRDRLKANV